MIEGQSVVRVCGRGDDGEHKQAIHAIDIGVLVDGRQA